MTQATYDVIEYAFYNDGSESGSTIIGTPNNQQTLDVDTIYLFRLQIHNDNNKVSTGNAWTFEFNHEGGGWTDVTTTAAAIQAVNSGNLVEGEDCTNRLTSQGADFIADNNGVTEDGTTTAYTHVAGDYIEVLLAFQIPAAQVADGDEILIRAYESGNSRTVTWSVTGDIDVNEGLPPTTIPIDTATITANGQALSLAPGEATTLLDTADITANGQTLALAPGEATTLLDTAALSATGQVLSLFMGEATTILDTAQITAGGQVLSLLMGETTVGLNTALLTANGQVIVVSLVTIIPLDTAQITANGQALSLLMGEATTLLDTALLTANGQTITVALATFVQLLTAQLTANGQSLTLAPGETTVSLDTAFLFAGFGDLFRVTFEHGDLSEFGYIENPDDDLWVNTDAAMAGVYGLECNVDDTNSFWGEVSLDPPASGALYYRFRIDPNSINMGNDETLVCNGFELSAWPWLLTTMRLRYLTATGYELRCAAVNDDQSTAFSSLFDISDAPHLVEVYCTRSTGELDDNGTIEWWVDGISRGSANDWDNYDSWLLLGHTKFGCRYPDANFASTFYLDDLVVSNENPRLTVQPGGVSVPLGEGQLTANGQIISLLMGEATTTLNTALLTANGQVITVSLATLVSLLTAQLTAEGQAISLVPGAVSIPLDTALLTSAGQALGISPGAVSIALLTAELQANGIQVILSPGAISTLLDTATLTAEGQASTVVPGEVTVPLTTALLTADGKTVVIFAGEGIIKKIQLGGEFDITEGFSGIWDVDEDL